MKTSYEEDYWGLQDPAGVTRILLGQQAVDNYPSAPAAEQVTEFNATTGPQRPLSAAVALNAMGLTLNPEL